MPVVSLKKRVGESGPVSGSVYKLVHEFVAELKALRTAFNTHTHGCDGGQAADYTSSAPGLDVKTVGVNSPSVAATVAQRVDVEETTL